MWIEVPVITESSTVLQLINTNAYERILPYGDGDAQSQFIAKGGVSIVTEDYVVGNLIADVPYSIIANQMKLFVGAVDVAGTGLA